MTDDTNPTEDAADYSSRRRAVLGQLVPVCLMILIIPMNVHVLDTTLSDRASERPDVGALFKEGYRPSWSPRVNWFGQRDIVLLAEIAVFIALFYALKLVITIRCVNPFNAVLWFLALLAGVVPYVVLVASDEWKNWSAYESAIWPGNMLRLLAVPTVAFIWDVITRNPRVLYLAIRTGLEVLVLVPLWYYVFPAVGRFFGMYWM